MEITTDSFLYYKYTHSTINNLLWHITNGSYIFQLSFHWKPMILYIAWYSKSVYLYIDMIQDDGDQVNCPFVIPHEGSSVLSIHVAC